MSKAEKTVEIEGLGPWLDGNLPKILRIISDWYDRTTPDVHMKLELKPWKTRLENQADPLLPAIELTVRSREMGNGQSKTIVIWKGASLAKIRNALKSATKRDWDPQFFGGNVDVR